MKTYYEDSILRVIAVGGAAGVLPLDDSAAITSSRNLAASTAVVSCLYEYMIPSHTYCDQFYVLKGQSHEFEKALNITSCKGALCNYFVIYADFKLKYVLPAA